MKKYNIFSRLLILLTLAASLLPASASASGKEELTYDVMYKWGLINKKAGDVTISTSCAEGSTVDALLTAKTAKWADRFYTLRDTLRGRMDATSLLPSYYERIAHEGGSYSHDILHYTRSGATTTANAKIWRKKKKENIWSNERTHSAKGTTVDMLSAFYFMRKIDYPSMKSGESLHLNVFSGKKKENLSITYRGIENIKHDGISVPTYHITFTFTTDDGRISSDKMDAWIYTAPSRIPLLMEGKLPVGKVRALYSGHL